jgi:hypothetical protein
MSTTPKKSSSSAPVRLTEMLAREGAPWRPFEEKGVLVKPLKTARSAAAIFAACERTLLTHLKAVCLWPAKERNESWRVGDYSYYILEFEPRPKTLLYVQFWSEPEDDDGVLFEVCSGALNKNAAQFVDAERQELLRDHGFELSGDAGNFRKAIKIENSRDVRAAAREATALLCKVLGYDGRQDLRFHLRLASNSRLRHVFEDIEPGDLVALLREWGFAAELQLREDGVPLILSRTDYGPFAVALLDGTETGQYQSATLRTFQKLEDPSQAFGVANAINRKFRLLQASVDEDGDIVIESHLTLLGGVTAEHLRVRFELWRGMLAGIVEGVE